VAAFVLATAAAGARAGTIGTHNSPFFWGFLRILLAEDSKPVVHGFITLTETKPSIPARHIHNPDNCEYNDCDERDCRDNGEAQEPRGTTGAQDRQRHCRA
jgi:hypothetical protein